MANDRLYDVVEIVQRQLGARCQKISLKQRDIFDLNAKPEGRAWGVFGELAAEAYLGRSHFNTFSYLNSGQGYGEQTFRNNWAVSARAGISRLLGYSPFSDRGGSVWLDLFAGLKLANATHTIQGSDGGPQQQASTFFGQVERTTVDPTFGAGVRVPMGSLLGGVLGGSSEAFVGANGEVTLRQGSVVTAPSSNFRGQTYYGTVDSGVDYVIQLIIGATF